MDIKELFLDEEDSRCKEYKTGWNDAVCYLHQMLVMKKRDGEDISIVLTIDEEVILEELKNEKKRSI